MKEISIGQGCEIQPSGVPKRVFVPSKLITEELSKYAKPSEKE